MLKYWMAANGNDLSLSMRLCTVLSLSIESSSLTGMESHNVHTLGSDE